MTIANASNTGVPGIIPERPLYAGGTLDRATLLRKNPAWLTERLNTASTRLLPVWRNHTLVDHSLPDAPRLVTLSAATEIPPGEIALLGVENDSAWFVLDLSHLEAPLEHPWLSAGGGIFVELRTVGALLPRPDANLAAYARGLMWWHQRQRFCGICGHTTNSAEAGHVRICTNAECAVHHFPRTDPAVIMLVHDGEHCLLGRQPRFPPGMYSTLAGFVEPGECLEEAVAREVFEETGVQVGEIRYHASQPWPFPSSLMLGFYAQATTRAIATQADEIEDARWFTRDDLNNPSILLPRKDSISRCLIEGWRRW